VEEDQPFETLFDASRLEKRIVATYQNEEKALLYQKLAHTFIEPYVLYRGDITELRQRQAVAAVPLAKDLVYENERIIDANERVTEAIYQKLYSLEVATADRSTEEGDWSNVMSIVGKYVMTILIFFIFTVFLANNRPRVYGNQKMFLLVLVLIFLPVGIGAFFIGVLDWPFYLIPTTISSMLFSMLFDTGIGFVATAVVGILLGGITGLDYTITLFTLVTGIIAVYSVAKIRTRNQIIRAIFFIIVGYFLVEFTFGTLRYEGFNEIFKNFVYYILPNAILSPIITYMMLGLFERVFDITTDVTLLELSDLNHPLLKDLSLKASGTFHHSIVVGSLAEAAAEAIGANSLLARVGSYYHDIGKMQKSEYFIENQKGSENRHQSLAPNMSAMILSAHVRNGMEMAEEHGLPRVIINFIPEHHGTNIMTYFYNKAMESGEDPNLNDTDFRYPGPIPQSKETAIVMLADTAEAATRTLKNPTSGRLRKRVEELAEQRFLEGQLDDCDLTMRDLKRIQEAFVAILEGIYHDRVEYPKKEEPKKTTAENKAHAKKPAGNEEKNGDTGSQPEPGQ
jgi:putative nucleotidyltransferase with HDIG domain